MMENLSYLFAAYSIIFAAIVLYVIFLWRRQTRLDSRMRGLEIQLNEIRAELAADRPNPIATVSRSVS
ncbi:MAG: CcmD family protein [Deltaproteobacteria bacterium]|nr:CcmD family protein [Deltaproteobacteria bacterium]